MNNKLGNYILISWFIFLWGLPIFVSFFEEYGGIPLPNDYARITDMDYKAVVVDEPGSSGKIVVTERITFDVHAALKSNGFWELWRDLCEDYIDGLKVYYKVNSVKQIMPDGREVIWPESPELYWDDYDYVKENTRLGPGKWYHSPGPYNEDYDRYECVFFYVDNLYREKITFEIEYEMYNAVLRYNDCADLYIAMYSGDTTKYLESFSGEILIPNKDMPREGNYKITTYGTVFDSFPIEESSTKNAGYHTFSFNLTKDDLKFRPYNEYLEFDLVSYGTDKHKFADYASKNYYYNEDSLDEILAEQADYEESSEYYKIIKVIIFIVCFLISIIVFIFSFKKIFDLKKKYKLDSSDSNINTFRDIPSDLDPKFVAALVFCKDKKNIDDGGVYSSILLSLARKGYISLEENSFTDVKIKINDEPVDVFDETVGPALIFGEENSEKVFEEIEGLEPLTTCEEHYLNLIKRHASFNRIISMSALQGRISSDYIYTNNFVKNINKSVVDNGVGLGYFQKADYLEPKNKLLASSKSAFRWGLFFLILANLISYHTPLDFAFGGYSILGVICIIISFYFKSQAYKCVLLTDFGEEEYNKWRGLYNFLKSDTLINEKTIIELPLWEKYLVYATAFGISEKVIKAIKLRCPETAATSTSIVHSSYCRSGRIRKSGRSFHSSVSRGSHSYSSSSGHSYGGGGRGGGGGGGGH